MKTLRSVLFFEDENGAREDWRDQVRTDTLAIVNSLDRWNVTRDEEASWTQSVADEFNDGNLNTGTTPGTPGWIMELQFAGDEEGPPYWQDDRATIDGGEGGLSNGLWSVRLFEE